MAVSEHPGVVPERPAGIISRFSREK